MLQKHRQAWVNRNIKFKILSLGHLVVVYNSKLGLHVGQLKLRCVETFKIGRAMVNGIFLLLNMYNNVFPKSINGFHLKKYFPSRFP